MKARWIELAKKTDFNAWGEALGVTPLTARLLLNRGIRTIEEARLFLYGTVKDLADPASMKDLPEAVRILLEARETGALAAIASDYDDDGIFSGQVLKEGLARCGIPSVRFAPDRFTEGYGLNRRIVDDAVKAGAGVLITCDNGIAARDEIVYAKERGLRVIVTDHHEPQYDALAADAVVDPKQPDCGYPYKELCGTGVAFRLIQALYRACGVPEAEDAAFYEYVAMGTVADVVPLTGENRFLVKAGLDALNRTEKPGFRALADVCGLSPGSVTAYAVGFVLGPCFNAVSRLLGNIDLAVSLLEAGSYEEALPYATRMRELNDRRKDMTDRGLQDALQLLETAPWKDDRVLVVPLPGAHESVIGIIAGRLKEIYYRPVFVLTDAAPKQGPDGTEIPMMKGSGRSIPPYHMQNAMLGCREVFEKFGGHAMAAGLSLEASRVDEFRARMNGQCVLTETELTPVLEIDARLPLRYATESLVREIGSLEPYGTGNRKPVFAQAHFTIRKMQLIGKNRNVLKFLLSDGGPDFREAVLFRDTDGFLDALRASCGAAAVAEALSGGGVSLDMGFTFFPDVNEYRGQRTVQLVLGEYRKY
ncbi:MAG: single-stranded-DNA-specific exonuclease RecJ [Lachnospiraceae bacterium]|nr:single-stranded-DNA-specific exonuclease RecJ [Lachnospiraceae bacterium]